jgi:SP family general alpha glucoside:H+ symporter-like MFS transporter
VYATEITPLALHPSLTTWTQICWTLGSLLASGILRAYVNDLTELAYKVPFTLQWAWLLPIAAICIFAPESPVWCVKTDRHDRAVVAIRRLGGKGITQAQVDRRLDEIDRTNRIEAKTATHISYAELFRGSNRRRTEIACVTFAIPCLCGFVLANSTYFMQQAGLDPSASFSMTVGAAGIALVCCFGTWFILSKFGRRPVYLLGLSVLIVALLGIGGLGIPAPTSAYAWATGGLCYVFAVTYYLTVGPVTYTIITDIPATRLRPKTVVLARAAHVTTAILSNVLHNYQINKTALNCKYRASSNASINPPLISYGLWTGRGKAGFFWAGSSALCLTWCYFRLPETRKRSSIELDELFTKRVPARMFARTVLDGMER